MERREELDLIRESCGEQHNVIKAVSWDNSVPMVESLHKELPCRGRCWCQFVSYFCRDAAGQLMDRLTSALPLQPGRGAVRRLQLPRTEGRVNPMEIA